MSTTPGRLGLHRRSFSRSSLSVSERQILLGTPLRPSLSSRPSTPPSPIRLFSQQQGPRRSRFSTRLRNVLRKSKFRWHRIPVGLGIGFLGIVQFYKVSRRNAEKDERDQDAGPAPAKRPRIRPEGPWQVRVMSTLPLKALSRLWGRFNELTVPYYLRVPGFKLYSYVFGVNLSEIEEEDLHKFPNLAAFFYRTLKDGMRPLHPSHNALLSPSDGRILQFGTIESGDIEQVKGMTYSLDALLGKHTPTPSIANGQSSASRKSAAAAPTASSHGETSVHPDEEFARVNGIPYTLPELLSGAPMASQQPSSGQDEVEDQSTGAAATSAVSEVQADLDVPWHKQLLARDSRTTLYYAVIYLAPGDYHRFHSPTNWVVERRRHFAGELYSVSPYLQRTLPGLFTLNERVVLLGRWRWGFFSYVPVGATNVGSIVVNFDRELRTNSLTTDTAADRAAEDAARRGEVYAGFSEATYAAASPILHGYALRRGEEMGGFQLGSTVVLVFEAPVQTTADSATATAPAHAGWRWAVEKGQTVKMGQALGFVDE
ncbi:phosphatidylserine decarboxylase proenzyme [Grosmannia clavigera kw1407]|uniref:Phosphatidylserine decarboxylase proenzyme 1, mitochondrial n=1 Tax=Grosmannia clavigera (strain kw1407 / UAMH 11150) TaxID=655863 RepID=F0XLZ9_GROCL|nr:phosphatidylserine decarboxylase proenzyme [Grosmannia clavigera kw1407]EFX01468.1 phosphatidylserine decarboxylase proenzyme [Grosmannia clavigera kw1407]